MSAPALFAQRQRVEVVRKVGGTTLLEVGTVVNLATEDLVRVELDTQPGVGRIYDVADVSSIPEAVSRHITRLIAALGAVSPDEQAAVEDELHRRLSTRPALIDFARGVSDLDTVPAAVRGLS